MERVNGCEVDGIPLVRVEVLREGNRVRIQQLSMGRSYPCLCWHVRVLNTLGMSSL